MGHSVCADDEELMQSASSIITACSGSMSCGGKVGVLLAWLRLRNACPSESVPVAKG